MIVRLTDAQRAACELHGRQEHRLWLCEPPTGCAERAGKASWDVPMPPVGWLTLLERLEATAFNQYGQRSSRVAGSVHRAARRLALRLARLEAHPAFHGAGLPGEDSTVLLGWDHGGAFTPYPTEGHGRAVWLLPEWKTVGGVRITVWFPGQPTPGWNGTSLDPAEHLQFVFTFAGSGE